MYTWLREIAIFAAASNTYTRLNTCPSLEIAN